MITKNEFLIEAPLTAGVKTVSTVAAAMFAGSARKQRRYQMIVYNESDATVYYGASNVTTSTGMPLLSGDSVTFQFNPIVPVDIYFIAGGNKNVRVVEL